VMYSVSEKINEKHVVTHRCEGPSGQMWFPVDDNDSVRFRNHH